MSEACLPERWTRTRRRAMLRWCEAHLCPTSVRQQPAPVEETASYLDGSGRQESKKLERGAAMVYASESMRLTTRLMQLASWLLLHRAVKEGEMTLAQASKEKGKVRLPARGPGGAETGGALPPKVQGI